MFGVLRLLDAVHHLILLISVLCLMCLFIYYSLDDTRSNGEERSFWMSHMQTLKVGRDDTPYSQPWIISPRLTLVRI
ncbi:hypothetical protein L2E82_08236 [Cichorium intybus]|uniref:Uncharacterized protein n=1 Tax=Cichorium intybus TaxID=13427 RepID=A0ACB9G611_CICIN|nr:hypothetical protein L2E82_08236 [Cichorium intybus]